MRRISLVLLAAISAFAATRPHYGGVLRVEVRQSGESADPPQSGPGPGDLNTAFTITRWEAGRRAVYNANDAAPGGRPFVDRVEVEFARPLREQAIDLELGKADLVELGVGNNELRRPAAQRKVWSSAPVRLIALVFGPRIEDARLREALALAVDRAAIHTVLLQRQGDVTGALLPQWLSGYSFLFPTAADPARARAIAAALPAAARRITLGVEDSAWQTVASRIALNARDAGLTVTPAPAGSADVRLVEVRIGSADPARALSGIAASLGLPAPPAADAVDALFAAERSLLEGARVIPLFHLPEVYGVAPRVKGGAGITPLGEWRFENLWIETSRP